MTYLDWGGGRIRVTWMPGHPLPPKELVTSANGLCFQKERLMLVHLTHRGADIPGGHCEAGESPEEACRREIREEGCVEGPLHYLGCCGIDHRENPQWRAGGKYPLVGYQAYYRMEITTLLPFEVVFESSRRFFVDPAEAHLHHHNWNPILEQVLSSALADREGPERWTR